MRFSLVPLCRYYRASLIEATSNAPFPPPTAIVWHLLSEHTRCSYDQRKSRNRLSTPADQKEMGPTFARFLKITSEHLLCRSMNQHKQSFFANPTSHELPIMAYAWEVRRRVGHSSNHCVP
jgi:hypothetical protein